MFAPHGLPTSPPVVIPMPGPARSPLATVIPAPGPSPSPLAGSQPVPRMHGVGVPMPPPENFPAPPSDEALRNSIAERFAGAYEAQLDYLSRVAAAEQQWLQNDVDALRTAAYRAQRTAAENRARADAARDALGRGHLETVAAREAYHWTKHETAHEEATLETSTLRLRHEETASVSLQERIHHECEHLQIECRETQQRRLREELRIQTLTVKLAQTRVERDEEAQAARQNEVQASEAMAVREQTLQNVRNHQDLAVRTLKEAVSQMEADFTKERADYAVRDRRALAQVRDLERQLDERRRVGRDPTILLSPFTSS